MAVCKQKARLAGSQPDFLLDVLRLCLACGEIFLNVKNGIWCTNEEGNQLSFLLSLPPCCVDQTSDTVSL